MERDKEVQIRADKEREAERARLEVADLKGQLNAASANDTLQTKLIDAMRQDIESARTQYLAAEKARMELQDSLARLQGDLDSESAARRQLQEQLQRVSDEKERALADVQRYAALHGSASPRAGATSDAGLPIVADRSLSATVIDVKREPDAILAEINAGSRDGVKEGWVMTIADGSNFVGNLRIVQVDVNRAVGVVELEDVEARGEVKSGHRAIARKGE
jgi:multidrug efflux pump subunit AcrA (membrane-fusion protein)